MSKVPSEKQLKRLATDLNSKAKITVSDTPPEGDLGENEFVAVPGAAGLVDMFYPVGSIYISTSSANPGTWMTGTTWVRYANGRVLVGVSESESEFSTVGKTGGEKTHKLTVNEMPSHTHQAMHLGSFSGGSNGWVGSGGSLSSQQTGSTGNNASHNNLQPYISVYIWRRTA